MKKIKNLFSTPKKTIITVVCMAAILAVLCAGTIFAVSAVAESSAIGEENAKNFAFADAGIDPASVKNVDAEFEFEQGQFVYKVEFVSEGSEYEYLIKASDGSIVKKEVELISKDGKNITVSPKITMDAAKETALSDAGLNASDVTFVKEKLDMDDGTSVYDIEFYSDNEEFEYEINANTGEIHNKSNEVRAQKPSNSTKATQTPAVQDKADNKTQDKSQNKTEDKAQTKAENKVDLTAAKSAALADAGVSESEVTFTKAQQEYDDGVLVYDIEFCTSSYEYDYEISAETGAVRSKDLEPLKNTGNSSGGSNAGNREYIGVDKAKSIAVGHAGFSASDVTFSKAKLDHDDGYTVYEIEFYKNGMEYEYTINALNGNIIEYDTDIND